VTQLGHSDADGAAVARSRAIGLLERYLDRECPDHCDLAMRWLFRDFLDDKPAALVKELLSSEQTTCNLLGFCLCDLELESGETVLERFLTAEGPGLSSGASRYLRALSAATVRLYEVSEVVAGEGMRLRDLWEDGETWIRERSASRSVVRWDLLAARIVEYPRGVHTMDFGHWLLPAGSRETLLRGLKNRHRSFRRRCPGGSTSDFFRSITEFFNFAWLAEVAFPPVPEVLTKDGDPLVQLKTAYRITDEAALRRALASCLELDPVEPDTWTWGEPASTEGAFHALGQLCVRGDRLEVETVSHPYLNRVMALVKQVAGASVRWLESVEEKSVKELLESARRAEPEPPAAVIEVDPDVERRFLDAHWREWITTPIPALGGRTPRQAARLKSQRPRLIGLLKELENHEGRRRSMGGRPYDHAWLWRELGIDRAGV
jgi:hypothetical protein